MASLSLTLLVPTHDRPKVLDRVWRSWLAQDGLIQVVLVNDGSTHDYTHVLAELDEACRERGIQLDVVHVAKRGGAPAARNVGLARCRGEQILTVDDDIVLPDDLVARCRAERPETTAPCVLGPRVVYLRDGETEEEADLRSQGDRSPYVDLSTLTLVPWVKPERVQKVPFVTAVALWPRELFEGGLRYFEGYLGNGYREETDPQLVAQERFGAEIYFVPTAAVFHLPPSVAYAQKGGQRRGSRIGFESWVLLNNAIFLRRHRAFLERTLGVRLGRAWFALLGTRFARERIFRALSRKFQRTRVAR